MGTRSNRDVRIINGLAHVMKCQVGQVGLVERIFFLTVGVYRLPTLTSHLRRSSVLTLLYYILITFTKSFLQTKLRLILWLKVDQNFSAAVSDISLFLFCITYSYTLHFNFVICPVAHILIAVIPLMPISLR